MSPLLAAKDGEAAGPFSARGQHLLDGSSCCIAWCTRATGSTAYTLRYAQKQGLRVWNVALPGKGG